MLLPQLDPIVTIMPAINMIARDVNAASLSTIQRFNGLPTSNQFDEASRVLQLISLEQ